MELQSQHGSLAATVQRQPSPAESRRRLDYERELQHAAAAILSLDQIKAIRSSNEYTEGPAVRRPPAPRAAPRPQDKQQERTHEVILVNVNNNYERHHHHHILHNQHHHAVIVAPPGGGGRAPGLSRSTSTGSAASSGSSSSVSSEQGLLARSPPTRLGHHHHHHRDHRAGTGPVRTQPKAAQQQQQQQQGLHFPRLPLEAPLKPPQGKAKGEPDSVGEPLRWGGHGRHRLVCERCGKCKCSECTAPRSLPSCLACDGQCLCSAESALEHGTCMCLVKGAFYHCSNDDEGDSCADQPCSLSRAHCCPRFLCMGLLSALFPCLLCYPPVKGCLRALQGCYDRVKRPGCRCRSSNAVYCKLDGWAPPAPPPPPPLPQSREKPS